MIRLTVLYNLQPYVDEAEFLEWRLNDHQEENMSIAGVLRSDFASIIEGFPLDSSPPYKYMTTADWPDMESFRKDFFDEAYQLKLPDNLNMLKDPLFLISEILIPETKEVTQ